MQEAELVLDDELVFDEASPRRSSLLRRGDDQLVHEGEVLAGKYRVERIPGRYGLGVVVQVRHMELGQEVTLKFLVPDACAYPEFVQRFVREARAAVKIQGEHVARVTDVGRLESGAPYIVREYLRGPDLAEVVKVRGRLPVEEAVDYVIQACEGVAEGHALGVVHRNIKPSSLVLTRRSDGTPLVKVFDFAAAESLHVDPFTERAVQLVGTSAIMASLPYLSPEQIRDPHDVDVRADIYSLGAVLYELLTGSPLYAADSAPALLAMVAADAAPPIRQHAPDTPGELDHVVLRCLAKNRAIRYSSIAELALALKPFASEESLSSIERINRLARMSKRPELGGARPSSSPASFAATGSSPAASPSAAPGRGPHGTLMMSVPPARAPRIHEVGNEDVTTISPLAGYAAPVVISPPPPAAPPPTTTQRVASPRHTPQPPPLAPPVSVPPPPRNPTPVPPPLSTKPPALPTEPPPAPASAPPRSSISGLTRSWAVADEPGKAPFFNNKRLVAVAVISACAMFAGVLGWRVASRSAPPVAAAAPARVEPPPAPAAPPPAPAAPAAPAQEPVAAPSASASVAPAAAAVPAPAAAPLAAAAAVAATPAPIAAPRPAAAPAPRRPAAPKPDSATTSAKPLAAAPEALARARAAAGPDLFDDPR